MFLLNNIFDVRLPLGAGRWTLLALLLAPVAALPQPQPKPQAQPRTIITIDRIVAVVNDEVITHNQLYERVRRASEQLARQGTPAPARQDLERQMLERMIIDRVLMQVAKEHGLRVDDVELDRAIDRIAQENKMVAAQLRMALEKDGVPFAKFREDIRGEIVTARLREREINDKVVVTETEIDNLLAAPQQTGANDEYNVSHVLVRVPENAGPEQIRARQTRAEQALSQLQSGVDFRQVAAAYSEAPDALQGGAMGWRDGARLPTLFADALVAMKPGALSGLLRSPNGFHILRLNERRGGGQPVVIVQQTRARHILVKVSEVVSEADARNRMRTLKERLDNQGDFAQLARANSEDTSAAKGGDLGWLSVGDTVPEFERAMDALAPGALSEPVRSPFGWHLIQVLERRSSDMSKEQRRLTARQTLRERKGEEAFQDWVRQTRDRAYVEMRLDER